MQPSDIPAPLLGKPLVKAGLFAGGALLVVVMFLVTNQAISRLSAQVSTTSGVLARLCADASLPATGNPQLQRILEDVTKQITFPIVVTDTTGLPRAWQGLDVQPDEVPTETIDSLAAGLEISPVRALAIRRVSARVPELDRRHPAIPMKQPNAKQAVGLFHYGDPAVLDQLRWIPYLAVAGTGLLLLLGMSGLAGIRAAEKRTIWVGMAKETAHQLGTPLSSLLGWVELLRAHVDSAPPGGNVEIRREELGETLDDMDRDIERLSRVAQRFSQIGSAPQLQLQDVTPVVREAVQYVRRRLPQGDIEIRERYGEVPPINLNRQLIEWAVENLLTNAVDALDKRPGLIEVGVERRAETEEVEITVGDNGRGMSREQQRRAFEPGYSSKRRGWGLGLALSRRVVQEYHAGRLEIRHSAPDQGTIMVIRFPT